MRCDCIEALLVDEVTVDAESEESSRPPKRKEEVGVRGRGGGEVTVPVGEGGSCSVGPKGGVRSGEAVESDNRSSSSERSEPESRLVTVFSPFSSSPLARLFSPI